MLGARNQYYYPTCLYTFEEVVYEALWDIGRTLLHPLSLNVNVFYFEGQMSRVESAGCHVLSFVKPHLDSEPPFLTSLAAKRYPSFFPKSRSTEHSPYLPHPPAKLAPKRTESFREPLGPQLPSHCSTRGIFLPVLSSPSVLKNGDL